MLPSLFAAFAFFLVACLLGAWISTSRRFHKPKKFGVVQPEPSLRIRTLTNVAAILDLFPFFLARRKATVEEIYEKASSSCGLSDFGDDTLWKNGLQAYFDDLWDKEAPKDPFLRAIGRLKATKKLVKRLKVLDAFKKVPALEETLLPRPIFIVGLPRTGSTILHQLLSQDVDTMTVKAWEWFNPVPPPPGGPDHRLIDGKKEVEIISSAYPILKNVHLTEAHEAEECYQGWIDIPFIEGTSLGIIPGLSRSLEYVWESDKTELYKNQKKILQLLRTQKEVDYSQMILKSPIHTIMLEDLHGVFPESTFVYTHRAVTSIVGSFVALYALFAPPDRYGCIQADVLGRKAVAMMKKLMERGLSARRKLEAKGVRFVDFYFNDLMKDPMEAIESLYNDLGMLITDDTKELIDSFYQQSLAARKKQKKPYRFTLEQLGLTAAEVDDQFVEYYEQFPRARLI